MKYRLLFFFYVFVLYTVACAAPVKENLGARNSSLESESRPYDAQLEYLACTRTQYIDTGIFANETTSCECAAFYATTPTYYGGTILGSRQSYNSRTFLISMDSRSGAGASWGNSYMSQGVQIDLTEAHVYFLDRGQFYIDGELQYSFNSKGIVFETPTPIWMFACYNYSYRDSIAICYCNIFQDGVLVREFIPVRIGEVGYMYDKVTGELFGNAGTGDFILGPDKE